jgi:guanylate kinase
MPRVFVITGPSGAGKGTIERALLARMPHELELAVSATTRPRRRGEVHGREYHFLSDEEFDRRLEAGEFLEHAGYAGKRYGTLRSELERNADPLVLEIEIQGARQVQETLPSATRVFIAPPSPEVLEERLAARGSDTAEEIRRRLEVARQELEARGEFEHVVVNDELGRAVAELESLLAKVRGQQSPGGVQ